MIDEEKRHNLHKSITTAWYFMKDRLPPENTDEYFETVTEDARRIAGKNTFLLELLAAVLHELRREAMKGEGNGEES